MKEDKSNKDRFELYRWLMVNGCVPVEAGSWATITDAQPSAATGVWRVLTDNREKCIRHLAQMRRQYEDEDPTFFNHSRLLVLGAGDAGQDRVVYLDEWLKQRH